MSTGVSSGKEPPDKTQGSDHESMETSSVIGDDRDVNPEVVDDVENSEENSGENNTEVTPVVQSYASACNVSVNDHDEIVDVLRIVLKKTKPGANYFLKPKEKAKLIFMQLGVPRHNVIGIDQEDFRTIKVHLNCVAAPWKIAHSIEVRDGLITLPMRMFRRYTKVLVMNAGVETRPIEVTKMLSHFGSFGDCVEVRELTYFENADVSKLTLEEKMMRGVKTGDFEVQMFITKNIPSFAMLESGKRVRVKYPSQPVTCGRCMQGIRGCKGGANAAKCEKKGGEKLDFANWWSILITPNESAAPTQGEQQKPETGEETVIPNTILRIEGLGKKAGPEWVRLYLSVCLNRTLEDAELKQSESKLAWEVSGLSPEEIQKILQTVSGTHFKGKTVYCVPVVTNVEPLTTPPPPPSETGSGGETAETASEDVSGEDQKTPTKSSEGLEESEDDDEDFEKVERKRRSEEKKKRQKAAKEQAAVDKAAEDELQKNLLASGGKSPGGRGKGGAYVSSRKRKDKPSPGKSPSSNAAARSSKRGKQGAAAAPAATQ